MPVVLIAVGLLVPIVTLVNAVEPPTTPPKLIVPLLFEMLIPCGPFTVLAKLMPPAIVDVNETTPDAPSVTALL